MPPKFQQQPGNAKLSLTLSPDTADELRRLADAEGIALAELVRRAVGLYRFMQELDAEEELCVRNRGTGEIGRLAILAL